MKRISLLFLMLAATPVYAASPAPGHYKNWDDRVDDLVVLQTFHTKDYKMVDVLPPDVSAIAIPTDNTHDAVRQTLSDSARIIADEVDSQFPNRMKIKGEPLLGGMAAAPNSMKLSFKFVSLDPGSRSQRGLSFGNSGKAKMTLTGELVDSTTNKSLFRFTVHNENGGHGDYEHVLQENLEHAVDRVVRVIKAFYP